MMHPTLLAVTAAITSEMAPDLLAETICASVEKLLVDGATRDDLIWRGCEMITAIREGERLRATRRLARLTRAVGEAGDYIQGELGPASKTRQEAVLALLRGAIDEKE